MKLEDSIAPYKGIIERHRRANAARYAGCFRIGGRAPGNRESSGPVALLGASGEALGSDRVEITVAYLGALGGLLADLGYDVFAISSLPYEPCADRGHQRGGRDRDPRWKNPTTPPSYCNLG